MKNNIISCATLAIVIVSCRNSNEITYHPHLEDAYTIEYHEDCFIISRGDVRDTFYINGGYVYDSDGILFFTTGKDTTIHYEVGHYQMKTKIRRIKGTERLFESKTYIEDNDAEQLTISYKYNSQFKVICIQRAALIDYLPK